MEELPKEAQGYLLNTDQNESISFASSTVDKSNNISNILDNDDYVEPNFKTKKEACKLNALSEYGQSLQIPEILVAENSAGFSDRSITSMPDVVLASDYGLEVRMNKFLETKLNNEEQRVIGAVARCLEGRIACLYPKNRQSRDNSSSFKRDGFGYTFLIKNVDENDNTIELEIKRTELKPDETVKGKSSIKKFKVNLSTYYTYANKVSSSEFFENFGETYYAVAMQAISEAGEKNKNRILSIANVFANLAQNYDNQSPFEINI